METKIFQTSKYDKFKILPENRNISEKHVANLVQSIADEDMGASTPIVVDKEMNIIDGQHRFEARKRLGRPIFYIITAHKSLGAIKLLNSTSRVWRYEDHIASFAKQGYEEFQRLQEFAKLYGISATAAVHLLRDASPSYSVQRSIKEGTFKIKDMDKAHRLAKTALLYQDITAFAGNIWTRPFLSAVKTLVDNFPRLNHEDLVQKAKNLGVVLRPEINPQYYLRALEEVYNHKLSKTNRLRFYV